MNERIAKLEAVLPMLATKGDVSESKASIVMWVAGVVAASTAIVITVLAFMLNRAIPIPQPTQQAPVVVVPVPANPPAPQSPPATKPGR